MRMQTEEVISAKKIVDNARALLLSAENGLDSLMLKPENNEFESLEVALKVLNGELENKAFEACEGAGSCGLSLYEQVFIVSGQLFKARLSVEYNRHDKTYYYIENSTFDYKKI